jgi:hypothetical protein
MNEKLQTALKKLSGMNVAHALVLALVAKSIFIDVSFSTVLLTVPVLAYEAYELWLKSKRPNPVLINDEVKKELELVKGKLNALTMDKNVGPGKNARYF